MYKELAEQYKQENKEYIRFFKEYLIHNNIDDKHRDSYLLDLSIYLYEFLPFYSVSMKEGCYKLRLFFTEWFVTYYVSSEYRVKKICKSLKKFYGYMLGLGYVEKEDYDVLLEGIKHYVDEAYNIDHGLMSEGEEKEG